LLFSSGFRFVPNIVRAIQNLLIPLSFEPRLPLLPKECILHRPAIIKRDILPEICKDKQINAITIQ
jgi:hypothetical protein